MNVEHSVVSKVIATGRIDQAFAKGIRSEHFLDDEARDVFEFVAAHARRYNSCPSLTALKEERPAWEQTFSEDSLEYLLDRFIVTIKRRTAQDLVIELAAMADDPEHGEDIDLQFLEASRTMATILPASQVSRFSDANERIADWLKKREEGVPQGVNFGFPTLDSWTGGIQPHELVTVAGFSGLGKSTMLMIIAYNCWKQGKVPLYISLEMEAAAILRKLDAMAANIDYMKIKQPHLDLLTDEEMEKWQASAQKIQETMHTIPIIDDIRGCTPDHIWSATIQHSPDIVIVDYLTLMRSSRPQARGASQWQTLTEITQDLKQNARTLGTPIVAAAQTNRSSAIDGAELGNIGYSLSIIQDSDIVLGLHQDDDMRDREEMEIRLRKNRDGRVGPIRANWRHETMEFSERQDLQDFGRPGAKRERVSDRPPAVAPTPTSATRTRPRPNPRKRPGGR